MDLFAKAEQPGVQAFSGLEVTPERLTINSYLLGSSEVDDTYTIMKTAEDSEGETPTDPGDGDSGDGDTGDKDNEKLIRISPEVENNKATFADELLEELEDDGIIVIDLKEFSTNSLLEVELSVDQISTLMDKNATLIIEKEDISIEIPSSVFTNGNEEVTITIERLDEVENRLSGVYDFSIKQGNTVISEFDESVTLVFEVDTEKVNHAENVKVFNLNEEKEVWEVIGGQYADEK